MEYRVVEISVVRGELQTEQLEVFESAYQAVDYMASSWYRAEERSARLYLIDSEGSVLLTPFDVPGSHLSSLGA